MESTPNQKCTTLDCTVLVQPGYTLCNACTKTSTVPAPADDTAPHPAVDDLAVVVLVLEDGPLTAHQITGMGREALIQYIRLLETARATATLKERQACAALATEFTSHGGEELRIADAILART